MKSNILSRSYSKMKTAFATCFLILSCLPVFSQRKTDIADLLIECYNILYGWNVSVSSELAVSPAFVCLAQPRNFYDNYSDERIGFDLLTQIQKVDTFSFSDSVYAPLKIPLVITSEWGVWRTNRYHQGVDFELSIGDTIYSSFCGEVRIEKFDPSGYGNVVVVRNYNMSETLYGHLDKSLVRNGQKVVVGQPIGIGGNTGTSTGPHLHFEIRSSGKSFNPIIDNKFFKKFKVTRK